MNRCIRFVQKGIVLLVAAVFSLQVQADGSSNPVVIESMVQQAEAQVFLTNMSELTVTEARISATPVDFIDLGTVAEGKVTQDILFLVDTSTSMTVSDQNEILHTLEAFLSSKPDGVSYALMTFGEENNLLCDFTEDRYAFQKKMETIQFQEQGSSFYAAITQALDLAENRKTEGNFVQLAVFTDGVEYDETGLTQNEMFAAIQKNPMPVHTFGCRHSDNTEQLKSLYSLSRISNGISMTLDSKQQPEQRTQPVWDFQATVRGLSVDLPNELRDGSIKTLGLYAQNNEIVLYDLRMPMTEKVSEPPTTQQVPQPEKPPQEETPPDDVPQEIEKPQPDLKQKEVVLGVAAAFLGVVILVVILVCKKRKKKSVDKSSPSQKETTALSEATEILEESSDDADRIKTHLIVSETEGNGSMQLVSCQSPQRCYTISLDEPALVGRDHRCCSVVLDMDRSISAKHCKIYGWHAEVFIEDVGSANHTFVNGRQTDGAVQLYSGDVIKLGRSEFEVRLEDEQR